MSVPIQTTPYIRLFKRLFLGQSSLEKVAFRQDLLFPEETATLRPAIFLPGQIEKVIDYRPTDTITKNKKETEVRAATSTAVTYAPTIAYHIKDAVLFDGSIYVGRFKHPIADKSLFSGNKAREPHYIKSCALASTYLGTKYFGHWLLDDCTRYLLAEAAGTPLCLRGPASAISSNMKPILVRIGCRLTEPISIILLYSKILHRTASSINAMILRARLQTHFPNVFHRPSSI